MSKMLHKVRPGFRGALAKTASGRKAGRTGAHDPKQPLTCSAPFGAHWGAEVRRRWGAMRHT